MQRTFLAVLTIALQILFLAPDGGIAAQTPSPGGKSSKAKGIARQHDIKENAVLSDLIK